MDPDHSITHHPTPFHLQHPPPRSNTPRPSPALPSEAQQNASSTGVELEDTQADAERHHSDVVARHPTIWSAHSHTAGAGGAAVTADVESQTTATAAGGRRMPRFSLESDPYGLSLAYKTPSDLELIKANTSRKRWSGGGRSRQAGVAGGLAVGEGPAAAGAKRDGCVPPLKSNRQARKVESFYLTQNETIERLLKSVDEHREEAKKEAGEELLQFRIAVWGSLAANVVLAALQLYGAVSSGSLSLFTTMADSIFDPLSNVTLILSNRAVRRVDPARFPSGKARLETVGNIVFCFLMIAVSLILIAFSAKELTDRAGEAGVNGFHLPAVIAVSIAFATKFALFLYCFSLRNKYSQIRILWEDHRNDLFINGLGILTSVGGSKLIWWVDPMGAIILSVVISINWLRTAFSEFLLLVGVVASVETQQLITYASVTHSPAIRQIDTVRVYHSGPRLIVEVDVVMDPEATLRETHDVAEALQIKLESLPDVERAYVHVDYETLHKPEHNLKKEL